MNGLHIAIDALFRLAEGGARTHLEQILAAWQNAAPETGDRISVFTTPNGSDALQKVGGSVSLHAYTWPGRSVIRRLVWEQIALPRTLRRNGSGRPEVLLCPGNMSPLAAGIPVVVMMRTMAPFCQDAPVRARLVGQLMRLSARRATHVICVSEAMRDLVMTHFGVAPARVTVIRHGLTLPPTVVSDPVSPYPFPYVLCVGAIQRYKHLAELIAGYAQAIRTLPNCDWRLVIAGHTRNPAYAAELYTQVERMGLRDRVIFTGGVPHAHILTLFRGAVALVHASTCESFGLPLLEAMTARVPIACSHIPASMEVVGDAALIFNPNDPEAIAAQLMQLADAEVRRELIERGETRLNTFEAWAEVAAQTRDVLLNAIHSLV